MLYVKLLVIAAAFCAYGLYSTYDYNHRLDENTKVAVKQFENPELSTQIRDEQYVRSNGYYMGWVVIALVGGLMLVSDVKNLFKKVGSAACILLLCLLLTGCGRKPFEPLKLEIVNNNEIGFLLPLVGDPKNQSSSQNEDYLKKNLVFTQQVRIPQQWVSLGYETSCWNGEWRDAAILKKVDVSPVTREWTADPNSGTSNRNEAIWVMTGDQVEFSTGWTCTARIASRDDAATFLHNYAGGTLEHVMDHEIRAKLQAEFGLEVTDLPMDELRNHATPHIKRVAEDITKFFQTRGIQITNFGITGGFVYKDPKISDRMVEIFNMEQEKAIRLAKTVAQEQENKKIILEADGKAKGLLIEKAAEAKGIQMVADAKAYEMQKAKESQTTYLALKTIELQKANIEKWDGKLPTYYIGSSNPNTLLQVPSPAKVTGAESK